MSWWRTAQPSVLVTICTVRGSAPREAGAKMLVWADGQDGTIGGGQLEFTVLEQARRLLDSVDAWRFQNYPLGPLLGQCCGGHVGLLLERIEPGAPWLQEVAAAEEAGRAYSIATRLTSGGVAKAVGPAMGEGVTVQHGKGVVGTRIGEGALITETVAAKPRLLMFGAGHVGQALAPILATLPFHLEWFDTRPGFARPGVSIVDDATARAAAAPANSFFLIFTQSHALDYDLARAVLARDDFAYCGLIGSATKRARFERRLIAEGIATTRLTCPIGAIGLTSKLPQAMAVAIAAELLLAQEQAARATPIRTAHAV